MWFALAIVAAASSGCGGSSDSNFAGVLLPAPGDTSSPQPGVQPPPAPNPEPETTPAARKVLIVDLDGATYNAVRTGIAAGRLPHLAQLQTRLAYAGGMVGTPSQQPTLDSPGWATLLTGGWAHRHRVLSAAPDQKLRVPTAFEHLHQAKARTAAAAVGSIGLARLLSADREANYLAALEDCSSSASTTDCVTQRADTMIDQGHAAVLAQYPAAKVSALDHGIRSTQYADTLVRLDTALGELIDAVSRRPAEQWLVVVTGNHGLSENSQDDGLPLVPESTTFIGLNQPANVGQQGQGAEPPSSLQDLYAYASIADIAPTALTYLGAMPSASDAAMDGASLVGQQAVSRLTAAVFDNNSANVSVTLRWTAPAQGALKIRRDGQLIAELAAGAASYTDLQLSQVLEARGTYQFDYTVEVVGESGSAARTVTSPSLTYVPPVPLAATLTQGLVTYYPFGDSLPPRDAQANSTLEPASKDLPAEAGLVVPGPFADSHALLVDTNHVTTEGLEGYRLTPAPGRDIAQGAAPQFTIGFWFKAPSCVSKSNVTILSNKNYVSGGNAGVAIGMFSSSGDQCGIAFNIGSGGGVRADGPTGPYTQITVNRWVYIAFSVDGVDKTMNMAVFDPVTLTTNRVATGKSTGSVDLSKLSAYPTWGVGDDGSNAYLMNKCNGSVRPPYTVGKCDTAPPYQQIFGDLAMWNRVLTDDELQSIFLSNKPLSSLQAQAGGAR